MSKALKAWMRDLQVILSSSSLKNSVSFGKEWQKGKEDIAIDIDGTKYMSSMKDSFTVRLSNLSYAEVVRLIMGQYYDIEIKAGYRSRGAETIFKGAVIYMSYEKQSATDNTLIILAGSKLVAKYGQSRMNLSLKSGINMQAALKFICKRAGIQNSNVDKSLKERVIRTAFSSQSTINETIDVFASSNSFIINSDSSYGNDITVINPYKSNSRVIELNSDKIVLVNGYPKLNSDGLSMTLLPTFNFMPIDTIVIDNSIIDISTESTSNLNNSMFLDADGKYMITQLSYKLQNREESFYVNLIAKSRSLFSKASGVEGYRK